MRSVNPFFTVCMPVYKSEPYIAGAIDDLLNQTFKDFECLVIDDCSPDEASDVAKKLVGNDKRFKFMKNKKNLGVSTTRNKGLEEAKGEYILFLDSDDRYDVELLQKVHDQVEIATNDGAQVDIVTWEFGALGEEDEKIKQLEGWRENELAHNPKPIGAYRPTENADKIFQINTGHMCAKAFRRTYLEENQLKFNPSIRFGEDALLSYTAICFANQIIAMPDDNVLYFYRRDQPNSAMHTIDMSDQMQNQLEVVSILKSNLDDKKVYGVYAHSFERWAGDGVGALLHRITNSYTARRNTLDEQVFAILGSRSWQLTQFLRKS